MYDYTGKTLDSLKSWEETISRDKKSKQIRVRQGKITLDYDSRPNNTVFWEEVASIASTELVQS